MRTPGTSKTSLRRRGPKAKEIREHERAYKIEWRKRNPDKVAKYNLEKHGIKRQKIETDAQRVYRRERDRAQYKECRSRVISLLGGFCVRCGINDSRVLEIDHKFQTENGIRVDRRLLIDGKRIHKNGCDRVLLRRILLGKIPAEEFQILCANCHAIKTSEEDSRPWQAGRKATETKTLSDNFPLFIGIESKSVN